MSLSTNNMTQDLTYSHYNEYIVSVWIWKIVPPILIAVGTIGNLLSILVLTRKHLRRSNISLFLIILAAADIASLYMCLLPRWLLKLSLIHLNVGACKFLMFFTYFCVDMSVWTLVSVTVYRAVSIWIPHRMHGWNKIKLALIVGAILIVLFAINAHVLYGIDEVDGAADDILVCFPNKPNYIKFYQTIWPWIDLCVFCVIPFTILVVGNVSIIIKVMKSKNKLNSNKVSTVGQNAQKESQSRTSTMTTTILVLNTAFFVTTSPVSVYLIGLIYWDTEQPYEIAKHKLAWVLVLMLMFTNNAINFFIYCLNGTIFRDELAVIFCGKKNRRIGATGAQTETLR